MTGNVSCAGSSSPLPGWNEGERERKAPAARAVAAMTVGLAGSTARDSA